MKGHLRIICSRRAQAEPYLREQSFRAPMHLSKPHVDEGALVVNLVNPTAGIFDDDEIHLEASVETGASLVLTTPSSSRIYRSRNGRPARVRQQFQVAQDGFLEFYPEPFIPHAGSLYQQHNSIHVENGGTLACFEWLTPGRVASGEVFQYAGLNWETDLHAGGRLVARERCRLAPGDESLLSMRALFDTAHYIGCFVISDTAPPVEAVHNLESASVHIGCGPLTAAGWSIRALCADSLSARRTLQTLRSIVHEALGRRPARLARF